MNAEEARRLATETRAYKKAVEEERAKKDLQHLTNIYLRRDVDRCIHEIGLSSQQGNRSAKVEISDSRVFLKPHELKDQKTAPEERLKVPQLFANLVADKVRELGYRVNVKQRSEFQSGTPGWYSDWNGYVDGDPEGTSFYLELEISW